VKHTDAYNNAIFLSNVLIGYGNNVSLWFEWSLNENIIFWDIETRSGTVLYPGIFQYRPADITPLSLRLSESASISQNGSFAYINLAIDTQSTWVIFDGIFGEYPEVVTIKYSSKSNTSSYDCLISQDLNGFTGYITGMLLIKA